MVLNDEAHHAAGVRLALALRRRPGLVARPQQRAVGEQMRGQPGAVLAPPFMDQVAAVVDQVGRGAGDGRQQGVARRRLRGGHHQATRFAAALLRFALLARPPRHATWLLPLTAGTAGPALLEFGQGHEPVAVGIEPLEVPQHRRRGFLPAESAVAVAIEPLDDLIGRRRPVLPPGPCAAAQTASTRPSITASVG